MQELWRLLEQATLRYDQVSHPRFTIVFGVDQARRQAVRPAIASATSQYSLATFHRCSTHRQQHQHRPTSTYYYHSIAKLHASMNSTICGSSGCPSSTKNERCESRNVTTTGRRTLITAWRQSSDQCSGVESADRHRPTPLILLNMGCRRFQSPCWRVVGWCN